MPGVQQSSLVSARTTIKHALALAAISQHLLGEKGEIMEGLPVFYSPFPPRRLSIGIHDSHVGLVVPLSPLSLHHLPQPSTLLKTLRFSPMERFLWFLSFLALEWLLLHFRRVHIHSSNPPRSWILQSRVGWGFGYFALPSWSGSKKNHPIDQLFFINFAITSQSSGNCFPTTITLGFICRSLAQKFFL